MRLAAEPHDQDGDVAGAVPPHTFEQPGALLRGRSAGGHARCAQPGQPPAEALARPLDEAFRIEDDLGPGGLRARRLTGRRPLAPRARATPWIGRGPDGSAPHAATARSRARDASRCTRIRRMPSRILVFAVPVGIPSRASTSRYVSPAK